MTALTVNPEFIISDEQSLRSLFQPTHALAAKKCLGFLDKHAATMPRVALRYAIEKLDKKQRDHYLSLKKRASLNQSV